MTLADACQAIADILAAALGEDWSCYPNIEPTFTPPAVFVLDPIRWENDRDFEQAIRIALPVRYTVPAGSYRDSRIQLSEALVTGKNALDASINLNGAVEALWVPRVENFGNYRTNDGLVYYAAEQHVEFMI